MHRLRWFLPSSDVDTVFRSSFLSLSERTLASASVIAHRFDRIELPWSGIENDPTSRFLPFRNVGPKKSVCDESLIVNFQFQKNKNFKISSSYGARGGRFPHFYRVKCEFYLILAREKLEFRLLNSNFLTAGACDCAQPALSTPPAPPKHNTKLKLTFSLKKHYAVNVPICPSIFDIFL